MSESSIDARDYQRAVAEAARRKDKIRDLESKIAQLEAAVAERDNAIQQYESDLADVLAVNEDFEAQVTQLTEQVGNAEPALSAEIERLKGELRTRDHRGAFDKLAKDKLRADALDAAWKLSGYTPEGDDVDEAKLGELVEGLAKSHPFLASPPEPAATGSRGPDASGKPSLTPAPPGPGAGRTVAAPAPAGTTGDYVAGYLQKTGRDSPYKIA